jgi:glycosyltransferase involved in cell wall biosynthesis
MRRAAMGLDTDLISVIIPCYRQAHLLPDAIESVLAQQHPRHEIVVVDDGSPDETAAVAMRYPVRYLRQPNQGLAAARNHGLRMSQGSYLVFLDADDRLLPNHLATSLEAFRTHPNVAFVCGDFRMIGHDSTWTAIHRCAPQPDHYGTLLRKNFISAFHTVMLRRESVLQAGGFRPVLKASEDYDLLLRLLQRHQMHCHHQIVAEYRRYDNQMSRQWDVMLQSTIGVLRAQRRAVRGMPAYEEAYREGLRQCRLHYGERAVWQMVALARSGNFRDAGRHFAVLASCYPQGLLSLIRGKVSRMLAAVPK